LTQRLEAAESEHERMNILTALACFSEPELIEESLAYCLEHVPDRNKFIPVAATAANPFAADRMWDWYLENLAALETFHPMLYERVIAAVVPLGGMQQPEAVRAFFETYVAKQPQVADVVKLSLEKLEINLRMRNHMKSV
jgi:tricorn protease interacting factor F2/3